MNLWVLLSGVVLRKWLDAAGRELTHSTPCFVIPAQAGIQAVPKPAVSRLGGMPGWDSWRCALARVLTWDRLDSRLRGNDEVGSEPPLLAGCHGCSPFPDSTGRKPALRALGVAGSTAHFLPALALALALITPAAHAHGGEDHAHDEPKAAAPAAQAAPAGAASLEASARLPDGSLFVPKHVQRLLALRTQPASVGPLGASVVLNGRVVVEPGSGGRIQATQPGTVVPAGKAFPVLGQKVRRGEVVAWLRPSASALERGDRLAQQAEVGAQVALAERRAARLEQLEGSIPAKEIEAARVELQALRKRQAALAASLDAPQALAAPVDGVISAVEVVAGQVVDAQALLFEVVDPTRLAVEAPAYDLALPSKVVSAEGQAGGSPLKLQPAGAGRLLREQALPMRFRVLEPTAPLAVGQPVKVILRTRGEAPGAAMPAVALVRDGSGQAIVWVHSDPERFEPRRVRHEALGADSVAVREGLKAGERVVTSGAALLSQVR